MVSSTAEETETGLKVLEVSVLELYYRDVSSCDYALTSRGYSLISKTVYGSYLEESVSWCTCTALYSIYAVNNTVPQRQNVVKFILAHAREKWAFSGI